MLNLLQLLKLEKVHPYFVWGSFFFVCFLKELFSTSLLSLVNIFLCLGFILAYFRDTFFFVCFLEGLCSTNILFYIYFVVCYNNKLYTWANFLCLISFSIDCGSFSHKLILVISHNYKSPLCCSSSRVSFIFSPATSSSASSRAQT